jgi:DNA-binding GntR family transcriptional regulator
MDGQEPEAQAEGHGRKVAAVARRIGAAIRTGRFVPGQRLVEAELTQDLAISRSLLREALRSLSAQGVIELVPNRGAVVRRLSRRETMELFQIRMELEGLAARLAAGNISVPGVRDRFEAETASIHDAAPRMSTAGYLVENEGFHAAVFAAAGNLELQKLNRQLQLSLIMAQISGLLTPAVMAASLREHRAIAEAVLAGDGPAADRAARAHLARARGFVDGLPEEVFRRNDAGPAQRP